MSSEVNDSETFSRGIELHPEAIEQAEEVIHRSAELLEESEVSEGEVAEEEDSNPVSKIVFIYCGGTPTPTCA